ncbi:MAG: hypothetical protein IKU51_01390 [Clostridia bacterium]|nr:hypothetical protein [Clostridia bacterium]
MSYHSDPTAARALGSINREFSRLEKRAKYLRRRWKEGRLSDEALAKAQEEFTGIYRHVLTRVLQQPDKDDT